MADRLSDLPDSDDAEFSPVEEDTMKKYFPSKKKTGLDWKLIGYCALFFFLLANPWIDGLFARIPYCGENSIAITLVKTLLFVFLLILVFKFAR